ncbi:MULTISPECIES: hypothetical protein [Streptomyces]|uniref:Uncharacterized protein n=1 Tax=Streptomyces antimycoticus TaxID=68175 RepID=A0ABD5J8U8_9ACTN|nr:MULTISPECIES: hypothetical protein [Streptomyces]MEE4584196.1 hypothetical protein [Streptomyces sp. DSM 41602]QTI87511.1 hypothetical protein AS97_41620 [Streptomyces sp. AgN23]WTA78999.1 hypothetical protein OG751_02850 [Streptomyces antimycoticus]WTB10671.1 hypothetical protein OG546_44940 [Streptomyces antimycoticus]
MRTTGRAVTATVFEDGERWRRYMAGAGLQESRPSMSAGGSSTSSAGTGGGIPWNSGCEPMRCQAADRMSWFATT